MKTISLAGSLTFALLSATPMPGQNIVLVGGLGTAPATLGQPVVIQAQPGAAAPVVYQNQVIYQAPAAFQHPGAYSYAPSVYASPVCTPNVVYIGGPHSYSRNYHHGYGSGCVRYPSPVVYFGRGEACQRGYHFTHYR